MSLFENGVLDEYMQHAHVQASLRGHVLLNKREFMAWMDPPQLRESTGTSKSRKDARERTHEHVTEVHNEQLQQLATHVCNGIVDDYGYETMDQIINDADDYDLLVAVTPNYNDVGTTARTKTITNNKIDKVVGFIVTELGECVKEPSVITVKLICVREGTIRGGLLMGAYLYCLKKQRTYKKMGMLELARGYLNVPGFISYTKLGFDKNLSLYGERCFKDYVNLPMSVNLTRMPEEKIIMRATENDRRVLTANEDNSGIYMLGRATTEELAVYNNLLCKAEMDYEKLMSEDNELKRAEQTCFDSVVAELSGVVASKSSSKKKKTPIAISKTTFIKEVKRVILNIVTSIASAESQSKSSAKSKSSKKGGLRNKRTRKNSRLTR
jgi:hypothetical protein